MTKQIKVDSYMSLETQKKRIKRNNRQTKQEYRTNNLKFNWNMVTDISKQVNIYILIY
jgi:hypothetical protein